MALAKDVEIQKKDGKILRGAAAAEKIYKGAICKFNAAGFIAKAAAEAGAVVAGIAMEQVDNSAGSAGDKSVLVARKGIFLLPATGLAQEDVGNKCYASADNLVSKTQASNEQEIGTIVEFISATSAWVELA